MKEFTIKVKKERNGKYRIVIRYLYKVIFQSLLNNKSAVEGRCHSFGVRPWTGSAGSAGEGCGRVGRAERAPWRGSLPRMRRPRAGVPPRRSPRRPARRSRGRAGSGKRGGGGEISINHECRDSHNRGGGTLIKEVQQEGYQDQCYRDCSRA